MKQQMAKCYLCPGKELKPCTKRTVGSGTLSNPVMDVWLCDKHLKKVW